jgi:hypothetical protein
MFQGAPWEDGELAASTRVPGGAQAAVTRCRGRASVARMVCTESGAMSGARNTVKAASERRGNVWHAQATDTGRTASLLAPIIA